ncbi:MAG: group 1 truncated hemoglobin [Proteobacteria bacterium]|nr:group 1 truncated hemoglobin [Pseudomonadota bacterium]
MPDQAPEDSLFTRIGGKAAVDAVVDLLYNRLLRDVEVGRFFTDMDERAQRRKMKVFLAYAFGALPNYSGASLREAHRPLVEEKGLTDIHFDVVAEHLQSILLELHVPESLVEEVMAIVGSTRNEVLNR